MEPQEASKTPYTLSGFILILNVAGYFWHHFQLISSLLLVSLSIVLSVSFDLLLVRVCDMFPQQAAKLFQHVKQRAFKLSFCLLKKVGVSALWTFGGKSET